MTGAVRMLGVMPKPGDIVALDRHCGLDFAARPVEHLRVTEALTSTQDGWIRIRGWDLDRPGEYRSNLAHLPDVMLVHRGVCTVPPSWPL